MMSRTIKGRAPRQVALLLIGSVFLAGGCQNQTGLLSIDEFMKRYPPAGQAGVLMGKPILAEATVPTEAYRIGPGDLLGITIYGIGTESSVVPSAHEAQVSRRGTIRLPGLDGELKVEDLTVLETQEAIAAEYQKQEKLPFPKIIVKVLEYQTIEVTVVGGVATPGLVKLRRTERDLVHALLRAGWLSPSATGVVQISRAVGEQPTSRPATTRAAVAPAGGASPADLAAVFQGAGQQVEQINLNTPEGLARAYAPLFPGDVVSVKTDTPTVYLMGQMQNAGPMPIPLERPLTVLQAVAAAGGTDPTAWAMPTKMTLIRPLPNDFPVRVEIDLEKVLAGKSPDLALASGDVLVLDHTVASAFLNFLQQNFTIRGGISATWNPILEFYRHQDRKFARSGVPTRVDTVGQGLTTGLITGSFQP